MAVETPPPDDANVVLVVARYSCQSSYKQYRPHGDSHCCELDGHLACTSLAELKISFPRCLQSQREYMQAMTELLRKKDEIMERMNTEHNKIMRVSKASSSEE